MPEVANHAILLLLASAKKLLMLDRTLRSGGWRVGALSPMERSAFVLRHFEGMSIEEVGRALGLRPSAAKHSIFRAVRKMRGALEPLMSAIR